MTPSCPGSRSDAGGVAQDFGFRVVKPSMGGVHVSELKLWGWEVGSQAWQSRNSGKIEISH